MEVVPSLKMSALLLDARSGWPSSPIDSSNIECAEYHCGLLRKNWKRDALREPHSPSNLFRFDIDHANALLLGQTTRS